MAYNKLPWLHLMGQTSWHSPAYIAATESGLRALRDAIDQALAGQTGVAKVFATDGEGYSLEVTKHATIAGLGRPPYLEQIAREIMQYEAEIEKRFRLRAGRVDGGVDAPEGR